MLLFDVNRLKENSTAEKPRLKAIMLIHNMRFVIEVLKKTIHSANEKMFK